MQITLDSRIESLLSESTETVVIREGRALEEMIEARNGRVVIFGAGSTGTRALQCLRSIGVEPLAIADNDARLRGSHVHGLEVLAPADAARSYGRDTLFIIAIWNAKHWYTETASSLESLGCNYVVPVSTLYWRFADTFLPFYCQDLPHKVFADRHEVLRAGGIWADEQSRLEYLAHVRWRTHGDWNLPTRPKQESYFADDIFGLVADESLVDCGAYDGDTLRSFFARCGDGFRHVDAIEPSPETCDQLRKYVSKLPSDKSVKIAIHECAVGATAGSVRFDATSGLDAHISQDGSVLVDVHPLDDLCAASRPSFIIMDIEGAECDALVGARRIIQGLRPVLAVCVYHVQDHLWKLPLLIYDMYPDYRMYLRTYEGDGWQAVVYAVPKERVLAK